MGRSKLDLAIERESERLNDAQREIVKSQYSVYKRNRLRISEITEKLAAMDVIQPLSRDTARSRHEERASLNYELNQLSTANSRISSELFTMIGGNE